MPTFTVAQALQLGITHHQAGRLAEAEAVYRQILAAHPNHPDALHLLGLVAASAGKPDVAEPLIRQAIAIAPAQAFYHDNLGKLLQRAGRFPEAVACFRRATEIAPQGPDGWFNLAVVLEAVGDSQGAIDGYQRVLQLAPNHGRASNQLGLQWRARGRLDEAERCFRYAIEHQPDLYEARCNLGALLESCGRYAQAIEQYRAALQTAPDQFMLHFNLGVSLSELGRLEEADAAYRRAIELNPNYAPAHNNRANGLRAMGRFDEAIEAYRRAIALQPDLAQAYSNLATIHVGRAEHADALAVTRRAIEIRPDHPLTHGNLCYTMLFVPEFDTSAIAGELAAWNRKFGVARRGERRPHANPRDPERRLRIGYVSPDFREHVIARNMLPAFRHRDCAAGEVFCYSNLTLKDAVTAQFQQLADHWRDVRDMDDARLDAQIRADGIDILVDLALHMGGNRLPLFARRPAPVQATFAGYPGSTGLETMDYRLTDALLEPPEMEGAWVEKSLRLPSFWCYEALAADLPIAAPPAAAAGYVTFGCLNNFCKVNDGMLDMWGQVLAVVPGARLMLLSAEGTHRRRTCDFLAQHGVSADRITFFTFRPRGEYLALYHQIDIGLDTVPYNGHTTSLDALWMGVPVVTLVGATEVGRAGLSQLTHLGLTELVTRSPAEYVQAAVALAHDGTRRRDYRATLRERMKQSILMDGPAFARALDLAYRTMWRNWCSSKPGS